MKKMLEMLVNTPITKWPKWCTTGTGTTDTGAGTTYWYCWDVSSVN